MTTGSRTVFSPQGVSHNIHNAHGYPVSRLHFLPQVDVTLARHTADFPHAQDRQLGVHHINQEQFFSHLRGEGKGGGREHNKEENQADSRQLVTYPHTHHLRNARTTDKAIAHSIIHSPRNREQYIPRPAHPASSARRTPVAGTSNSKRYISTTVAFPVLPQNMCHMAI